MPLLGEVDFGAGVQAWPSGVLSMIGNDGGHYQCSQFDAVTQINISHAESETFVVITAAQMVTDMDTVFGAGVGADHNNGKMGVLPCPGTPFFFAYQTGNDMQENIAIRYRIDSISSIVPESGFLQGCGGAYNRVGSFGCSGLVPPATCWGCNVIGNFCYAVMTTGGNLFDFNATFRSHLVRFPLTGGVDVDQSVGAFDSYITLLSWDWGFFHSLTYNRSYRNRVSIMPHPDGLRLDTYVGQAEIDLPLWPDAGPYTVPIVHSIIVDPDAHSATTTANVSSEYGVPFDDVMKHFDGSVSGSYVDDWTGPYFSADVGKIFWARADTEAHTYIRYKYFDYDPTTGIIVNSPTTVTEFFTDETPPPGLNQDMNSAHAYWENDELLFMFVAQNEYIFGSQQLVFSPVDACTNYAGYTDFDLPEEELACDIEWPFDDLRPRSIGIYPNHASLSGGMALTQNEPVFETDIGFWGLELGAVSIRTIRHVRKWREVQSALNGRQGTCCVHIFDGKRAPWEVVGVDIDAQAFGALAVGAATGTIMVTSGGELKTGMHFSSGERLYRITDLTGPTSDPPLYDVTIWPPVRTAIADGASLEFSHPVCRMRLETDDQMNVQLNLMRFASPTVRFVEDI